MKTCGVADEYFSHIKVTKLGKFNHYLDTELPDPPRMRKVTAIYATVETALGILLLICITHGDSTKYSRTDPWAKVKAFALVCLFPWIMLKILALVFCRFPSTAKVQMIGIYAPQILFNAIWSIWVIISLTLLDRNQPVDFPLVTMIFLLFFYSPHINAYVLALPLFGYQLYSNIKTEVDQANENIAQIKCLPEVTYDPSTFKSYDFCTICMEEFTKDSKVTYMPCDPRHYFDTQCITYWLLKQTTCPLCKTEVDYEKSKENLETQTYEELIGEIDVSINLNSTRKVSLTQNP